MTISAQIEDLIERNASDFEISKLFKSAITEYKTSLPLLFEDNQGKDFLVKHTKALDEIITTMYKTVLRRSFGTYLPMRSAIPIAVIALGSYGREQLCVHSDVDLMIVYEEVKGYNTNHLIEKLLYLAWDAGLKLGHRVHSVGDLFGAANEDITIRTAMMESRFICGSTFAWHATQRVMNTIRYHEPKAFLLAKVEEAMIRRDKFPLSMQPNIKESVGGLRDSQLLYWCARTLYDVTNIKDLSGSLFSDEAYREYRIAIELLFRVRSALHLLAGKQQDQLIMELMPRVAVMLGFADEKRLTTKVLEALNCINIFSQIFVKKIMHTLLADHTLVPTLRHGRLQRGFYIYNDMVCASYRLPTQNIDTLLDILIGLEDRPWRFDAGFKAQLAFVHITHPLKTKVYAQLRKLFEKEHLYPILRLFYDCGTLHHLITVFKKVLYMPQFDGYHDYPVVLHSIRCVEALENIKEPYIKTLYDTLNADERLLLKSAVLLHDAGKGRKSDHSDVGAKLIVAFVKHLKLKPELHARAALLVKHHILMSNVAFREDIHNEKTLYKFMSSIMNAENLKLLYILTYADINGVGERTYTSFGAKLLCELYHEALEIAEQSDRITDASKRMAKEKRVCNLAAYKALPKLLQKKILGIESNLFFFKYSPEKIIDIANVAHSCGDYTYRLNTDNGFIIQILRRIPLNLGYLLGKLSYLDVASMEVFTLFDEIKYFQIEFFNIPSADSLEQIRMIIDESFDMNKSAILNVPTIKHDEITINCDHSKTYAQVNIHTSNQRGLLAYIVECFERSHMNIATAKVHTTKHRARDHFLIEKRNNMCERVKQLSELLCQPPKAE